MPRLDADGSSSDDSPSAPAGVASDLGDNAALPQGDALTLEEAAVLCAARRHRVIVVLGERRAGKTTLLAELHQAFLKGPFNGYLFAGSDTLVAFEKRCALGRTTSRRENPATPRTPLKDGVRLLHLAVRDEALARDAHQLLFTDVSGELSKAARRSQADAEELAPIVAGAARVVVVVDGAKIADASQRQRVRTDTKTFLRALAEVGGLHAASDVDLVLNKWDWVADDSPSQLFANELLDEALQSISKSVNAVVPHRVSTRPRRGSTMERWVGLGSLLSGWVATADLQRSPASSPSVAYSRSFLNYRSHDGDDNAS